VRSIAIQIYLEPAGYVLDGAARRFVPLGNFTVSLSDLL